jgi:hypothetical protein
MNVVQTDLKLLPQEVRTLLDRVPSQYLRDLALDLAWAALVAPRRPDALHQVIQEWEVTLEEIELAGDDLTDILKARDEVQAGVGMNLDELRAYLDNDDNE